jgi:beta-glucosidase
MPSSALNCRPWRRAGGGFRGRIGDLMGEDAGRANVLAMPLATIVEFPGVPLEPQDMERFVAAQNG